MTSAFWAGNIFISKVLIGVIPPITLNFLRWFLAMLVLLPFVLSQLKTAWPIIKQNKLILVVYAFLGVSLYNSLLYSAAYTTTATNIAVISTVMPLLTFIFIWLFFGKKPASNQVQGFVVGLIGVLILLSKGDVENITTLQFTRGDILMLTACIAWSIYTAILVKKPAGLPAIVFLFLTVVMGSAIVFPVALVEILTTEMTIVLSEKVFYSMVYIAIFPSLLSYWLFNHGAAILGSQTASLTAYLIPIFTAVFSIVFLNEKVYWFHIVSQMLVFLGFYLSMLKKSRS